ncbi:MAG: response regulator [Sedimentisphaerales bacterium]|nr:response regulator [Sedimentisphaerales bacterium]
MELRNQNQLKAKTDTSNDQLLREHQVTQAALEAKSRLIDNMAYQIRTLSNAVIGFSDLLYSEDLEPSLKEYVAEIYQAGKALSVLVNDVLDLAKLESGKLVVSKSFCLLDGRLQELYQLIHVAARQKGLQFSITAEPDVPARMFTDGERLVKCLLNLCANAVKYTPKGYIRVHVSCHCFDDQAGLRFDVEDSGIGIAPERLASLFDEVVQTEKANHDVLTSMDMGLSITASLLATRRLVEALGGRIDVTSTPGVGSTFSLLMPAGVNPEAEQPLDLSQVAWDEASPEAAKTEDVPAKAAVKAASTGTVLLVEDQESNRTVMTLLLETLGLSVVTAEDGVEAVAATTSRSFDVILMDLMLPRMDGYQAADIMRQNNISCPIIALSAGVMNESDSQRIAKDFDGFLYKPVDSKKLQQTLQKYLPQLSKTKSSSQPAAADQDDFVIEYK